MAVQFSNTSGSVFAYYQNDECDAGTLNTFQPFTTAVWYRATTVTGAVFQTPGPRITGSVATHKLFLGCFNGGGGSLSGVAFALAPGFSGQATGPTFPINTWTHLAAVFRSTIDRQVFVNGIAGGVNTAPVNTIFGKATVTFGADDFGANGARGAIAEGCVWRGVLTSAEIQALAQGVAPLRIQPEHIVCWHSFIGRFANDPPVGGSGLARLIKVGGAGSPVVVPHPRIFYGSQVGDSPPKNVFVPKLKEALESSVRDVEFLVELDSVTPVSDAFVPINTAPVVFAGNDTTAALSVGIPLHGEVTDDGLPSGFDSGLTTAWTMLSGPGTLVFDNETALDTIARPSVVGTYVIRLTANDGELAAHDEVTVAVTGDQTGITLPRARAFPAARGVTAFGDTAAVVTDVIRGSFTLNTSTGTQTISVAAQGVGLRFLGQEGSGNTAGIRYMVGAATPSAQWVYGITVEDNPAGSAGVQVVQSAIKDVKNVNNTTLAFTNNLTAGNTLIVAIVTFQATAGTTISDPTDTRAHTYTANLNQQNNTADKVHLRSWRVPSCQAGACTVTAKISGTGTGEITMVIMELNGVDTANPLSVATVSSGPTTTDVPSSGNITPAHNNCLLIGVLNAGGVANTITPEAGWNTEREYEGTNTSVTLSVVTKLQTTAVAEDADWTLGSSIVCLAHILAIKPASTALTNSIGYGNDQACIEFRSPEGTVLERAVIDSINATDFQIDITVAGAARVIDYELFVGPAGGMSMEVGHYDPGTGTGNFSVNTPFQGKAVEIYGGFAVSGSGPLTEVGARLSFGMAASSTKQFAGLVQSRDGQASSQARSLSTSDACFARAGIGAVVGGAPTALQSFVSFNSVSFTVNRVVGNSGECYFILFGGSAAFTVKNFTSPPSNGSQALTGFGFTPFYGHFLSAGQIDDDVVGAGLLLSDGSAKTSSDRGVTSLIDIDGANPADCSKSRSTSGCVRVLLNTTPTVDVVADFTSQDIDGSTLNWTTTDATARLIGMLAIGGASASAVPGASGAAIARGIGVSVDSGAGWVPFMPGAGGSIVDLVPAAADPTGLIWYCGGATAGGPFRSDDGGKVWVDKAANLRIATGAATAQLGAQSFIATDPTNVNRVYVAFLPAGCLSRSTYAHEGVFRSDDGGDTWIELTAPGAKAISRGTIIVDAVGRLFGFVSDSTVMYVSVESDQGVTFVQRTAPLVARPGDQNDACTSALGGSGSMVVAVAPNNRLFYGSPNSTISGVWYTDDQGQNWVRITSLNGPAITLSDLACDPGDSDRVLAAMRNVNTGVLEIWVSSDNGETFTKDAVQLTSQAPGQNSRGCIAINFAGVAIAFPQGAFAAARPSARSTARGALGSWGTYVPSRVAGGNYSYQPSLFTKANRIIAHPKTGVTRWVSCNDRSILVSEDVSATTWREYGRGLGGANHLTVAVDSTNANNVLIALHDKGLVRTTDGGTTWVDVSGAGTSFSDVFGLTQDPILTTRWYRVRGELGQLPRCSFQESLDGGVTWSTRSLPTGWEFGVDFPTQVSIIVDPNNTNIIYVGWSKDTTGVDGLYRSSNRGTTFALVAGSVEFTNIVRVGRDLYGFTAPDPDSVGGEFRKYGMDTGLWTVLRPSGCNGFAVHPTNALILWSCENWRSRVLNGSATKGTLWKSVNGGSSWVLQQRNGKDFTPHKIYIDPIDPTVMLMACHYEDPDGVFRGLQVSRDAGASWTDFHSDLPQAVLYRSFVYGGVPGRVYACTVNEGCFRLDGLY